MTVSKAENRSRIIAFDILKCFAIFLVVWGHVVQHLRDGEFAEKDVFLFIYSFHMPLFMMISGFFFARVVEKPKFTKIIGRKFQQYIIPFICWITFTLVLLAFYDKLPIGNAWKPFFFHRIWFLKGVFLCCLLAYVPFYLMPKHKIFFGGGYYTVAQRISN